jgi:hypothetical protein
VDSAHGVVLTTALAALLCLPCVVVAMMRSDDLASRRAWVRRARIDRPLLRGLDRGLHRAVPGVRPSPQLDQVAAELQRLHRQRTSGPTRESEKWLSAVAAAYDAWLQEACRCLAITHHLARLDGIDRDLERIRVEAALTAAGLRLPPT